MNETRFSEKTSKFVLKGVYIANLSLLLCHVYFLVVFKIIGAEIMHYVNYASVLTYLLLFILLKNGKKKDEQLVNGTYVVAVYAEMYIHMIIATVCLGYEYGFLLYCISNASSVVCAAYFLGREKKVAKIAEAFVVLNVITYVGLRIWTYMVEPIYVPHPLFSKVFFIGNSLLAIGFSFYFSKFFASVTSKQEDTLAKTERQNKDFHCGRWGGEEFLITYLLKKKDKEKAIETLEGIRKSIESQVIDYQGEEIRYTVTIGAAFCDADSTEGYIITEADQMLYQGKQKSRNCVMY